MIHSTPVIREKKNVTKGQRMKVKWPKQYKPWKPKSDPASKLSKRYVNQWDEVSKRLELTLLSYWKNQNLSSKIFKICPQASLGHSACKSNFRSPVKCSMRTFRTGLYMQGAETQNSRRLSISTVRKSLKVNKNFQNQEKFNLVL